VHSNFLCVFVSAIYAFLYAFFLPTFDDRQPYLDVKVGKVTVESSSFPHLHRHEATHTSGIIGTAEETISHFRHDLSEVAITPPTATPRSIISLTLPSPSLSSPLLCDKQNTKTKVLLQSIFAINNLTSFMVKAKERARARERDRCIRYIITYSSRISELSFLFF